MRPKGIEELAEFSARDVKRAAAAAAEKRDECFSVEGQWESKSFQRASSESQSRWQSLPSELSES